MSITQEKRAQIMAECYRAWDVEGARVLDVGCGNGVVSQVLREGLSLDLIGTDILDYRKKNIPFKKMESDKQLPFEANSFDYVMFNDVLHHSEKIEALILEGKRVGRQILVFEDRNGILLRIIDKGLNYLYSPQMPCPLNFKTREEWCELFSQLGFKFETGEVHTPFWYPFRHEVFRLS